MSHRNSRDIAAEVTRTIIAKLEAGSPPWIRPWSVTGEGGRPLRHEGSPYLGINSLWLWAIADTYGYRSRYWMTARQAEELGGRVRRGAQASMSIYASTFRKTGVADLTGQATAQLIRFLRSYTVYNADEIDGLPGYYHPRDIVPTPILLSQRQTAIDAFFAPIPAELRHGGDRAFFHPVLDYVQMPKFGSFRSADSYASVLSHELSHWSGGKSRLDRTFGKRFGDEAYGFEELVAELSSSYICAELGLPSDLHNSHASYIASWLSILRADQGAVFLAATKAEQAFRYLRAFSHADGDAETATLQRAA